ncbi:MAG: sugar phosphate nucleotidyltransferase [Candidatus Sumerlaeia bacterium]
MATGATLHNTLQYRQSRLRQVDTNLGTSARWGIILAGGEGSRLYPLTQRWLGENRPKQYCAFSGNRTLLQRTVERATAIMPPENLITIIGNNHRRFLNGTARQMPGRVISQPTDRGTAMGIFLGATYVYERNPEATIVIFPSDQCIKPEKRLQRYIEHACRLAERTPDRLILLGATPARPETDYGWIEPVDRAWSTSARRPLAVKSFHERPRKSKAECLIRRGCLWNTMIMVCKVRMMWAIGWQMFPDIMRRFDIYRQVLRIVHNEGMVPSDGSPGQHEEVALHQIYRDLKSVDFSREVLQYMARWSLVVPMENLGWCDVGQPQTVREALAMQGGRPAFPIEYLDKLRYRR